MQRAVPALLGLGLLLALWIAFNRIPNGATRDQARLSDPGSTPSNSRSMSAPGTAAPPAPGANAVHPDPARPATLALPPAPSLPSRPAVAQSVAGGINGAEDLHQVQIVLEDFRNRFGGFPAGDNREIVNALAGANPQRLAFLPRDHPAINDAGELTDGWGTPLFFHHLASGIIEIRSAGPDRQRYTPDDLLDGSPAMRRREVRR